MKMKRLLGVLLTIVLMLDLLPGMGFTAYADVPQEGSNKYVGYRHDDNGFIVYGKREKDDGTIEEIQTTFGNYGYKTVMKVGESGSRSFDTFAYGKEYISNDVKASVTARVRGKGVLVTYTLFNDSDELKKVNIGSYADTQIYNDDKAPCSFTENGIKMTSVDGTLEFQLIPGGGNFTTRWYGKFYDADDNVFNDRTDPSTYTDDSGIAWSWTIDIPARATITKTAELSAGQVGTKQIIYDANGGTGEMDPTVDIPAESIKLNKNTFTKDDYVFQGWDTNSAGTTVVYADEATLTMPDTDTTLYAVWKENTKPDSDTQPKPGTNEGDKQVQPQPQPETKETEQQTQPQTEPQATAVEAPVNYSLLMNSGLNVSWKGSKVKVKWGLAPGADAYEVYAAYCGSSSYEKVLTVQAGNQAVITKLGGKKLNPKKSVKAYVVAYKNGTPIGQTIDAHSVGGKNKATNVKKIRTSKKAYTLTPGKSVKLKVKTTKANSKKKLPAAYHCASLRYASSDERVAIVTKKGRIKAVGAGTCDIWVYAQNGRSCRVTVVVK